MALVLFLCTGCGVWSSAPASEETRSYRISSHEAAALLAELLAVKFSAVNPDQGQPRAYAMDLEDGNYRILYVRGDTGLFLPQGNGLFVRDHFLGPKEEPFLKEPPASPLGRIWFRHIPAVSPRLGGSESLRVEVRALTSETCTVRIESRSRLESRRQDRIVGMLSILDAAERLKLGLRHYRKGEFDKALVVFNRLCVLHDDGRSSIHDSLLAQAHALAGLILQRQERGEDARRELALARMRAPASGELRLAWTRLMDDMGRPGDGLETQMKPVQLSYVSSLAKARDLMKKGRYWAARNWARRARDLRPRGVQAQLVLAVALDGLGRHREARDLRLLSLYGRKPDTQVLLALAENERQLGHPEMALRWILRNAEILRGSERATRSTNRLIAEIGIEQSLRMMRIEGRHESTLPLIHAWIRRYPGPRAELLSSILAAETLERQRAKASDALLTAEPLPDPGLPGASGLIEQRPVEPVAPSK